MPKVLNVRGPIITNDLKWIYDLFEYDSVCPNDISKIINEAKNENDSVVLRINSGGGYVTAGAEMYEEIKSSDINVEARVVGNCCSAATYLVCGANKATMSPLGQFMIHRCAIDGMSGNANDLQSVLHSLNETDRAIAYAYSLKTGKTENEILELMDKETWMSAQTAKINGFIDEILFADDAPIANVTTQMNLTNNMRENIIPDNIINMVKQNKEMLKNQRQNVDFFNAKKSITQLNLLKLGGK